VDEGEEDVNEEVAVVANEDGESDTVDEVIKDEDVVDVVPIAK